jgi:hypothetical protein
MVKYLEEAQRIVSMSDAGEKTGLFSETMRTSTLFY